MKVNKNKNFKKKLEDINENSRKMLLKIRDGLTK